jgi:hypothetical protein
LFFYVQNINKKMQKITNIFGKTFFSLALIFLGCLAFASQSLADYQTCSGWSCCSGGSEWAFPNCVYSSTNNSGTNCTTYHDEWGYTYQSCTTYSCTCSNYSWTQVPTVTGYVLCTDNGCAANTCIGASCYNDVSWVSGTKPCDNGCAASTCIGYTCWNSYQWVGGTKPCNGACGTTGELASPPASGSCSFGTPANFGLSYTGHWTWNCLGIGGGATASCGACIDTCTPSCTDNTETKCKADVDGICQIFNYTNSCLNYGANGRCNDDGTACTCSPNANCDESDDECKGQSCDSGCFSYGSNGIISGTRRCVTIDDWKEVSPN